MDRAIFRVIPPCPETLEVSTFLKYAAEEKFLQKKQAAFRIKPNETPHEDPFKESGRQKIKRPYCFVLRKQF